MAKFSIHRTRSFDKHIKRQLVSGEYHCKIRFCEHIESADNGPSKGLPEIHFIFRIASGPLKGLEIHYRAPTREPNEEEKQRGVKDFSFITENLVRSFVPTYKTGDELDTDVFIGREADVTVEMIQGSKWPRIRRVVPRFNTGELGSFDETQFGDPDGY